MKYLWNHIETIERRIKESSEILLFIDFDGTVSPIIKNPDEAKIDSEIKSILKMFIRSKKIRIIIISGRMLSELKKKIRIKGIDYVGNHGLEWELKGNYDRYPLDKNDFESLDSAKNQLTGIKLKFPDVYLQDKILSLSVHYRNLKNVGEKEFKKNFYETLSKLRKNNAIHFREGKKVIDIYSKTGWNKGMAAKKIRKLLGDPLVISIGDDTTDEDMFKKLNDGITVRVGKDSNSSAEFYVKDISEVTRFLNLLATGVKK